MKFSTCSTNTLREALYWGPGIKLSLGPRLHFRLKWVWGRHFLRSRPHWWGRNLDHSGRSFGWLGGWAHYGLRSVQPIIHWTAGPICYSFVGGPEPFWP